MSNEIQCIFCQSRNSRELYPTYDIYGNNFLIRQCTDCKAFFLAPRPAREMFKRAYDDSYYGETEEKFSPIIEKVLDRFRSNRAATLHKYLQSDAKILDIGCGNGKFLSYLSTFGNYQLYGTELMGSSARRAARISQINLKLGILEESDFAPQTFDAITLFHVFEHLTEPRRMLRTISTILKQEGLLIMSLPNIASWQSRLFKGKWLHLDPPRHLCFFAPADLINILKEHGFELIRQRYFSVEQNPYGMVQSILNILCSKREVLFERLKGNKQYAGEYSPLNIFLQKIFLLFTFPVFILTDLIASSVKKGATMEFTFENSGNITKT